MAKVFSPFSVSRHTPDSNEPDITFSVTSQSQGRPVAMYAWCNSPRVSLVAVASDGDGVGVAVSVVVFGASDEAGACVGDGGAVQPERATRTAVAAAAAETRTVEARMVTPWVSRGEPPIL